MSTGICDSSSNGVELFARRERQFHAMHERAVALDGDCDAVAVRQHAGRAGPNCLFERLRPVDRHLLNGLDRDPLVAGREEQRSHVRRADVDSNVTCHEISV
jgi:hypothetical protein